MHEFSIVSALLDLVAENARLHNVAKVTGITVKIGVMSGVEPDLFAEAFHTCKRGTVAEQAELNLVRQDIAISCSCGYSGGIEGLSFRCPECGKSDIQVTDGEEMILLRLEMDAADSRSS